MKRIYSLLIFLLVTFTMQAQNPSDACVGVPALTVNGACVNMAYTLPGTYANGGMVSATCQGGLDRDDGWYSVTAVSTNTMTIELAGGRGHTLAVFATCGGGVELACDDQPAGTAAIVNFTATNGVTYYVQVHRNQGNNNASMIGTICAHMPALGAGDDCATALNINCGDVVAGNTSLFTPDTAPTCGTKDGTGGGVWYRSTATCTAMTASLCGSGYDTKIRVFEGSCATPICVTGNDDFCGLSSQVSWVSTLGTTYFILVHGFGAGQGAYSLALTCGGVCCTGTAPVAEFSVPTTVCEGTSAQFMDASTCTPTSWSWSFPGGTPATSTAQNPIVTYATIGTYTATLTATNAFGSDVEVKTSYINVINCAGSCVGNYYYIRSNTGSPWGSVSNEAAMDAVFGAGVWTQEYFQTANPATLFSAATCTIFMDGSDAGATEFEVFLNANIVAVENWVAAGGRLFLNTAPNEDNGMSYGFGGTTMNYPSGLTATGNGIVPGHAIFNGPFLPVGLSWTGNWFAHGNITNAGTSLITDSGTGVVVCSEKSYGAGVVVFGVMTTANWHTPALEGQNLRQNILCYISPPIICGTVLPIELTSFTAVAEGDFNLIEWTTTTEVKNDYFSIQRSTDAENFVEVAQVDGAGTSLQVNNYEIRDNVQYDGVLYYRLKQTDFDGEFKYSKVIAIDNRELAEIDVFPSPADDLITVTLVEKPSATISYVIRNTVGTVVWSGELNDKVELINVSEFPGGIYFISMQIDGKSTVQKFSVK